jgi:signal transduction histidine kinase
MLAALLCVALFPFLVGRRSSLAWDRITRVVEPARALASELQLALALEAAGTRGYLLTGDPSYAASHHEARARRRAAHARLVRLARELPAVRPRVLALGERLGPADARLDSLYGGRLGRAEYLERLPAQQSHYRRTLADISRLHAALGREQEALQARVRADDRAEHLATALLVLLAMAGAVGIARVERGYRLLAGRERDARGLAERALAEVDRVSRSHAALLRGFSHDVKNPLNAANGYLGLLELGVPDPLTPAQAEAVARVRGQIRAAVGLIEDLLDLARVRTGEISVQRGPVDLRETAEEAVAACRSLAAAKGLALRTELPEELPAVESDRARIAQVLGNLVGNAVKYTQAGEVVVRVGERPGRREEDAGRWAVVSVVDTGPGLTGEEQKLVFQEFRRLGAASGTSGAGIGLTISRKLARALGGDVTVHSEPGRGSTFELWLPLGSPPPASPSGASGTKAAVPAVPARSVRRHLETLALVGEVRQVPDGRYEPTSEPL